MKQEKCISHNCNGEIYKAFYCRKCWDDMRANVDDTEGREDQNVPDENTGQWPW